MYPSPMRLKTGLLTAAVAILTCGALASPSIYAKTTPKIRHVIVIMQENRSFDSYFGTFPGAHGIPADTCVPLDPSNPNGGCIKPFHDQNDVNAGGPHGPASAEADLDGGIHHDKMDGFVHEQDTARFDCPPLAPNCAATKGGVLRHDVMGYHTNEEIPNYWEYAKNFVLQDRLFEGVRSWSWPSHLDITSEWVAVCADHNKASTCTTDPNGGMPNARIPLPWVNLFQLLDVHGVSWKYYLGEGPEPDCVDGSMTCDPQPQNTQMASIWNPAPFFSWVRAKGPEYLRQHNPKIEQFLADVKNGTLPQVSWIVPADAYSEHPPAGVTRGMDYVTSMVNAVMESPYWKDTAIFIAWDDWGGFYDHVVPPNVDHNDSDTPIQGYGLRVAGLMVSAYAKRGTIDHNLLSLDSYATFIEDLFINGARLDPKALGNPDHRPDIRDALTHVTFPSGATEPIGKLMDEFDFTQKPLPPLVLSTFIPSDITISCAAKDQYHCTDSSIRISWSRVKYPSDRGRFVYHVKRDGVELPQCTGTATHCEDTPGSGTFFYRAYSVDPKGVASPLSAASEAIEP
jgi:phospholipase C